jgi:predicted PurR-regulated permease PerM
VARFNCELNLSELGTHLGAQMDTEYQRTAGNEFDWKNLTLFLITVGAITVCALMLRPFLPAVTGAFVLAIVTQRPHQWIAARQRSATLAATTSLVLVTLCIIGPVIFIAQRFRHHLLAAIRSIQNGTAERGFQEFLDRSPRIADMLQYFSDNISLSQALDKSAGFVAARLASVLGGSVTAVTQIIIMLFLLFFLYRDRELGRSVLRSILPLKDDEADYLLSHITETIQATVLGRFVVAGTQGLVAGITFASLGISGASLLGIVTALFAMVPSFGAFVVWLPVAIYLAATHHWVRAAILVAVGSLIISTLDNFLYPVLVGSRLRLHTVPIFLSILGGIWLFGISGLVLDPIAFTLTESLLLIWNQKITPDTTTSN